MSEESFPIGKTLWQGDVDDSDVSAAWMDLFGEPFSANKAVETRDLGDTMAYLMPGGYVVHDVTYETNHGIYAPPRFTHEGATWGLLIQSREDPIVLPFVLPLGYELTDPVRQVYQRPSAQGERHNHRSRSFTKSEWYGAVYIRCGSEREALRERGYYMRTAEEVVLDAVKDWYDKKHYYRDQPLAVAVEHYYSPRGRACVSCSATAVSHTLITKPVVIGPHTFHVHGMPALLCARCGEWTAWAPALTRTDREAASRALRYYGSWGENLKFARHALGDTVDSLARKTGLTWETVKAWDEGSPQEEAKLNALVQYMIRELEETW